MDWIEEADGVFRGGGVKGLGLAGALLGFAEHPTKPQRPRDVRPTTRAGQRPRRDPLCGPSDSRGWGPPRCGRACGAGVILTAWAGPPEDNRMGRLFFRRFTCEAERPKELIEDSTGADGLS
jgi:hypothetical protein